VSQKEDTTHSCPYPHQTLLNLVLERCGLLKERSILIDFCCKHWGFDFDFDFFWLPKYVLYTGLTEKVLTIALSPVHTCAYSRFRPKNPRLSLDSDVLTLITRRHVCIANRHRNQRHTELQTKRRLETRLDKLHNLQLYRWVQWWTLPPACGFD